MQIVIDWGSLDWNSIIGTLIAAAIPSGIALYLARRERQASLTDRRDDRAGAARDHEALRVEVAQDRFDERLADAAASLSIAIDRLSVAAFSENPDDVTHAALGLQAAAVPLLMACRPEDEPKLRLWVERSGVLYREFAMRVVKTGATDRRIAGAAVTLIGVQLLDWMRGRATVDDLLLVPPEYRDRFAPDNEVLQVIPQQTRTGYS